MNPVARAGTFAQRVATIAPLERLTAKSRHPRWLLSAIVVGAMLVIAWLDYITASRLSLVLIYMAPITLAVVWLGRRAASVVAVTCVALRAGGDVANAAYAYPFAAAWNRLTDLLVYLVLVWVFDGLITLFRNLDGLVAERTRALQKANDTRQALERELTAAGARERSAIGRELHDDLCQQLVATAFAAQVLAESLDARGVSGARDAQMIVSYVEQSIAKTRSMARGLLLASIDPSNLPCELAALATAGSEGGILCRFRLDGHPSLESAGTAAQLFRIAQEAMRNAIRHARASNVDMVLAAEGSAVALTVSDDGIGMPAAHVRGRGMGLQIMEHRAALIGGTLSVHTAPNGGTRVVCRVPCTASAFST